MKQNLETTAQSIVPEHKEKATAFADFISMQHDEATLALRHGSLYVVYDFSAQGDTDTALINKFVTDVLHNTYYTSQSASPIQPLEKAALELKERLAQFAKENNQSDFDFNILMAVVWGEVLYIVSYGKTALYIMRDGALKTIDAVSEGNFSIASGLVKDMDIVFLSTQYFVEQYTPDKIFKSTTPILQSQLNSRSAAVILKFNVTTEFSENDMLDIINPSAPLNIKKESDKKSYKFKKGLLKLRPSQTSRKKKIAGIIAFLILAVLFAASVYALSQSNKEQQKQENVENLIERAKQLLSQDSLNEKEKQELKEARNTITKEASDKQDVGGVPAKIEEALNLKKVDSSLFYDLAIVDKNAKASEIAFADDGLYVADTQNGNLYFSTTTTAKFTKVTGPFAGIQNLGVEYSEEDEKIAENLVYTDASNYSTFVLANSKEGSTYKLPNPGLVFPYLGFIYEIDGDKINKYTKGSAGKLTSTVWATDANLKNIASFTIDESIYVLLTNGTINKYTSGVKGDFSISGLDVKLLNPTRIYSSASFDHMYILDVGNKRVVQIDKNGKFTAQYMDSDNKWSDLRDITVSANEKTLYVLSGNKVFEVSL